VWLSTRYTTADIVLERQYECEHRIIKVASISSLSEEVGKQVVFTCVCLPLTVSLFEELLTKVQTNCSNIFRRTSGVWPK